VVGLTAWAACPFTNEAVAKTIYSYIDDRGNPVYTDAPETIPERYRAKVKTHEQRSEDESSVSVGQVIQRRLRTQIRDVRAAIPSFQTGIYGLTPRQSEIVTYAGTAAAVLLLMMYLGKSPFTRLLGLGLLMVLGIAVPVLMYVSDDGPADRMKKAATEAGQAQHDRLKQTSQ
jgi:hypothetical protein